MRILKLPEYDEPIERYRIACDAATLRAELSGVNIIAVDTETYYAENNDSIIRYVRGAPNNVPFCMTLTYKKDGEYPTLYVPQELIQECKFILEDENVDKILHNSKYDMHMFLNIGIHLRGRIWDTMIMIHLIDEEFMCKTPSGNKVQSKALKNLAYHFLGEDAHELEDLVDECRTIIAKNRECVKQQVSYLDVYEQAPLIMKDYASADTEFTYKLYEKFLPELIRQELTRAYDTDINATIAVLDMERNGFTVEPQYYEELKSKLEKEQEDCLAEIHSMGIPEELNINSSKDLVKMYSMLGQEWHWFTDKGEYQTSESVIKSIASNEQVARLSALILQYREAAKLAGTFISQIQQFTQRDSKIHANFNVCPREDGKSTAGGTVTGRLSSSDPNFQNFPKDDKRVRYGMKPSEGFVLCEIDYSQQEYRLLAEYANDAGFSKIIHDGKDIHIGTAELMLDIAFEEAAKKKNRDIGKRINFALVYGMGKANLANSLKLDIDANLYNKASFLLREFGYKPWEDYPPVEEIISKHEVSRRSDIEALEYYFSDAPKAAIAEAERLRGLYFTQFPSIPLWLKECTRRAASRGYSKTLTGRRRHFKHPKDEAYKAPNATIQGGCGDITKKKMWECYQFLLPYKSRMINNIHDAIVFEIHKSEMHLIPQLKDIMISLPFRVPFDGSVEISEVSWGNMEEVDCNMFRR